MAERSIRRRSRRRSSASRSTPTPRCLRLRMTRDRCRSRSKCRTSATSTMCRSSRSSFRPGDQVAVDDPLLTLESDKATMDVPAPFAGVIGELRVKVGDRVSQGTALLTMAAASDNGDGAGQSKASAAASDGAPVEAAAPDADAMPRSRRSRHRLSPTNHLTATGPSTPARAPAGPRASSASSSRQVSGTGRGGRITPRGRRGICEERAGSGFAGRPRVGPRSTAMAVDRLREVRPGRARGARRGSRRSRRRFSPATG